MSRRHSFFTSLALLLLAYFAAPNLPAQPNHEKNVWNYDGGLLIMTDGSIASGPCFRLSGRVTAPEYFENLKRTDSDSGSVIHRGSEVVTEFPEQLHVSFLLYDFPCDDGVQRTGTQPYLTNAMVSTLRLSFYWKHGVAMRPVINVVPKHFEVRRIPPYATELASKLPEHLQWEFEFEVPSSGIPVTDSLVAVLHTRDGRIAARAAARM